MILLIVILCNVTYNGTVLVLFIIVLSLLSAYTDSMLKIQTWHLSQMWFVAQGSRLLAGKIEWSSRACLCEAMNVMNTASEHTCGYNRCKSWRTCD